MHPSSGFLSCLYGSLFKAAEADSLLTRALPTLGILFVSRPSLPKSCDYLSFSLLDVLASPHHLSSAPTQQNTCPTLLSLYTWVAQHFVGGNPRAVQTVICVSASTGSLWISSSPFLSPVMSISHSLQ